MMKRSRRVVVIKAAAVGLAAASIGCPLFEAPEPPSRVVERVERAGAGNVRTASNEALQMWFNQHDGLAVEVNRLCATSAAERIPGRTEARVCVRPHDRLHFLALRRTRAMANRTTAARVGGK
jgi:hypothetical protein